MFAEVAVPVAIRQTFTYRLVGDMAYRAQIGCRVVVPLNKKLLTGFIVALHETLPDELLSTEIREVEELLDETPIIDSAMLALTRWMSDYYYAPWGECIRAALPLGAAVASEQMLTITDAGRAELAHLSGGFAWSSAKHQALELLYHSGTINAKELARLMPKAQTASLIRTLKHAGFISVSQHAGDSRLKAKLQNAVRLKSLESGVRRPLSNIEQVDESNGHSTTGKPGHFAGNGKLPAEINAPAINTSEPITNEPAKSRTKKRLTPDTEPQTPDAAKPLTEQQQRVINLLAESEGAMALSELLEQVKVSASVVRTLEKRGIIEVFAREVRRDPLAHLKQQQMALVKLNDEQQQALDLILEKIEQREYATFLLHGVTGSGKTEIYIRAMMDATRRGLSALMLIPEIALTPMFSRRLRAHFGDAVAILHSSLSDGERLDEWRRIKEGEARIVIGTRSAVFAPLQDLGLIVIDEEHETSYKQDESPRYHGRDTAIMRAVSAKAVVVIGSATPSLESFHNAHIGKSTYIRLETRYGNRPLADVQAVDMREVFKKYGKQTTFSDDLKQAIAETYERKEQAIVLLNRRGFSSFALCRTCGEALKCINCDVTLTYHRFNSSLVCHYCNYMRPAPKTCPHCDGQYIQYVGEGTEQIEAKLKEMFPDMNIARVDRDTTRKRGSLEHLLMEFAAGTIDLLVGTQILAKGHDFHNVTLVGVISVDVGLSLPDFRAAERTFQLLTQVAGRAGRGSLPGRVIIQTYHPEHYALVCARGQDYEEFYHREIMFRRSMHYPPFTALININVHDKEFDKANAAAMDLAKELRDFATDASLRVLGPAPAPISRIKGDHRFQILIKARSRKRAREALDFGIRRVTAAGHNPRSFLIEVDPISLM
ncbi:MAG: primosomal protein N' [Acidobacteria bacterium]|nr:primosomal protein N' [Acidobacteriota bacterium]